MRIWVWTAGLVLFGAIIDTGPSTFQGSSTFDIVQKARACSRSAIDSTQTDCEYKVGKSLRFSVAGVGTDDAGIVFAKSDADGDFFASMGMLHGCVIVWPGRTSPSLIDLAFVSPVNGKAYRDWPSCKAHK
jgi:hypothetical protein